IAVGVGDNDYSDAQLHLWLNNGDGTFSDMTVAWGLDIPSEGRGIACFDYDRDGDIDVVLLDHSRGLQFYENQTGHQPGSRFLQVRLVGRAPNTDALGAKVYVTADVGGGHGWQRQMRVSQANSNFNGQNLPDLHFGLGHADRVAALRIEWPDGTGLVCQDVEANQFLIFDQRDKLWPKLFSDAPDCLWHSNIAQIISDALSP
ncbi:MAG: CRTAC1 family protein, partial [Haliea sp.]